MAQSALQRVPIEELFESPQIRSEDDPASLDQLAASIKNVGILQPIRVLPSVENRFEILLGARRWKGAKLAGLTHVPVIVDSRPHTPATILQLQFVENVAREDLPALDRANGIARFMKLASCNAAEAAVSFGICPASVSNLLSLLTLPDPIQQQLKSGAISATNAYELARIPDAAQQLILSEQLATGSLPSGHLARAVKASRVRSNSDKPASLSRATAILTGGPSVTVAGESLNLERFIEALEEVLAKARRVRGRGVELPTFVRMLRDEAKSQRGGT